MKKIHLKLIISIFCLTSCVKFEDIDIKTKSNDDLNFAVFCLLSPSDSIFLTTKYLNKIGSIIDESVNINADIKKISLINVNKNTKTTLLEKKNCVGVYYGLQNIFPIIEGNTYELIVELVNSTKVITAKTTVPKNEAKNIEIYPSKPYFDVSFQNYVYNLSGSWKSNSESAAFRAIIKDNSNDSKNNSYLIGGSDLIKVADTYNFKFEGYFNYKYVNPNKSGFIDANLDIEILTLDENFSKFSDSFDIFLNIDDYILNGFGLASLSGFKGIIPKFNSVENGYGVFGSCMITNKYNVVIIYPK